MCPIYDKPFHKKNEKKGCTLTSGCRLKLKIMTDQPTDRPSDGHMRAHWEVSLPTIGMGYIQGYILCKILGEGGKWCRGKMKNEAVRNKMKKRKKGKEKEEKEKGESDFFANIWHTSVDHCILT